MEERGVIMKDIIDETYNGDKYPIIEREYNAYFFPENYNPDTMENQAEAIMKDRKEKQKKKTWRRIDFE